MKNHLTAKTGYRIRFDLRRRRGHHHDGPQTQFLRRKRHALGMVSRRRTDHAAGPLRRIELDDLVVGAADLE